MICERTGIRLNACAEALVAALLATGCAQQPVAPAEAAPQQPPKALTPPSPPAPAPAPAQPAPQAETRVPAVEHGRVSVYALKFAGKTTASGERFDPDALTMAHPTLPFGTRVRVTNLENHRTVLVRVNDRGPAVPDRIADLSPAAARKLGLVNAGVIEATLEVVEPPED